MSHADVCRRASLEEKKGNWKMWMENALLVDETAKKFGLQERTKGRGGQRGNEGTV
jgi:hypothetical protein